MAFFWTVVRALASMYNNFQLFPLPMKALLFVAAFSKIASDSISPDVDRIMKVESSEFLHVQLQVLLSKSIYRQPLRDLQ